MKKINKKHTPAIVLLCLMISGLLHAQTTLLRYTNCTDYATVGTGLCSADDLPTPVAGAPVKTDPVQEFLDNYGKPPREFAEFFVNPTPENAKLWAESFRAQQAQAAKASEAWRLALQDPQPSPTQPAVASAQATAGVAARPPAPNAPRDAPSYTMVRLGAFAIPAEQMGTLTYYLSMADPFSARMTPDLQAVMVLKKSKYKFTCVDLTPFSPQTKAQPQNRAGLPCDWRLPLAGEVQALDIQQTPALIIQRRGQQDVKKFGLLSRQQMMDMLP